MALFGGMLGMEAWYFPAVMGLIIEDSKLHGASETALSPRQEPSSKERVDLGSVAWEPYPWGSPHRREDREHRAIMALKSAPYFRSHP